MVAALAARRSFHCLHPTKGANPMYTRVVELTSKSGKARELCDAIDEKVVPILKKQTGFVDETVLASDAEPNRVLGISFWNSKEDAERYHREQYPQIHETMKPLRRPIPSSGHSTSNPQPPTGSAHAKLRKSTRLAREKRAPSAL